MRKLFKKQNRLGFTLAEVLAVIGIIVILLALGVPGFIALRKNIQITEYDDIARQIYIAAQNQLTRLSVGGMDSATADKLAGGNAISSQPSDFDSSSADWSETDYQYTTDGSTIAELLLPFGSVTDDVRTGGHYIIEYNASTYIVYGVFYSDDSFNYPSVDTGDFRTNKTTRKSAMVGYYGGSAVARDEQVHCNTPELTVTNDNELTLTIAGAATDYTVYVTVSDGTHTAALDSKTGFTTLTPSTGVSGTTYALLLDSLETDKKFKTLFPELTPGADLTITVTFMKEGALPTSATVQTNSLFAARETGDTGDAVTIACARHLQNLDTDWSGLPDDTAVKTARQTEDINWSATGKTFTSITNANLTTYNGNYQEIAGLNGTNGLFKTATGMTLSHIRVVNPTIRGGGSTVGGLVGTAANTTVTGCGVYCYAVDEDGSVDFDAYDGCGVTATSGTVGGLIGSAMGCTITESFAALPALSGSSGGGLIGSASGCDISLSYASCDDLGSTRIAYFLSGSGNTIDKCYAVGNLAKDENGSFAGSGNNITQSYYAVSHTDYSESEANDLAATEYATYDSSGNLKDDYNYDEFCTSVGNVVGVGSGGYDTFSDVTAPLTHPYREGLDGRAYPYPGFYMLEHYGSWPTGDGTVTVTILMNSTADNSGAYLYNAGHVRVYELDEDGTTRKALLFDNTAVDGEQASDYPGGTVYTGAYADGYKELDSSSEYITFSVAPGTKIQIVVDEVNSDYAFVSISGWPDGTIYQKDATTAVNYSATVKVNFKPNTFTLTAEWPQVVDTTTGEDGETTTYQTKNQRLYSVQYTTNDTTALLQPGNSADHVSYNSLVTVSGVTYPTGYTEGDYLPVVTYTTVDQSTDETTGQTTTTETVTLTAAEDGKYTFYMPSADTTINVRYVERNDMVQVTIRYYVQGTDGIYTSTEETQYYVVGTEVNKAFAEALATGKEVTSNGEKVLSYSYFELYDNDNDNGLLASTKEGATVDDEYALKQGDSVTLGVYIARAQYDLTLQVGEKIESVSITYTDGYGNQQTESASGADSTVRVSLYYGQSVTALAVTEAGQTFTVWETDNPNFRQSSAQNYTFTMPCYNLTLTASAKRGEYLVSLELTKDNESWLESADFVKLYLVNTKTEERIPLTILDGDTNSYIAQNSAVPAVEDIGEGYNVLICYKSSGEEEYTYKNSDGTDYQITVRQPITEEITIKFFSVTYNTTESTSGTVPEGGTYPANSTIQVQGNTGLLKNGEKRLIGWKDGDVATLTSAIYKAGDDYTVTGKTYFFAQWLDAGAGMVVYAEGGDNVSGELPLSWTDDLTEQTIYTVEAGSLTRPGYTFAGWACSYGSGCTYTSGDTEYTADGDHVHQAGDKITLQPTTLLTLTAKWETVSYSVTYYGTDNKPVSDGSYTVEDTVKVAEYNAETMGDEPTDDRVFIGWATTRSGDVSYYAGEKITGLTENLTLYAVFAEKQVQITYHYNDNETATQVIQYGTATVLNPGKDGTWTVTAWSASSDGTGQNFYLCEEGTAHTASAYSLTPEESSFKDGYYCVELYPITGKVYNYIQYTWYDTLYDAVNGVEVEGDITKPAAQADETLIVYRDTEESKRIEFTKDLYVVASGSRTIKWTCDSSELASNVKDELGTNEFCGCMFVDNCAVTFGESELTTGVSGTLTFDANKKSRVIALKGANCEFKMVDGVTLTHGLVSGKVTQNARISTASRQYMGGGVYAADGAYFNMAGGTISYCQATAGGGVYIVGVWKNNKWGKTDNEEYNYSATSYENGAKFSMGGMEHPKKYSSAKIYYKQGTDGAYVLANATITTENYRSYYVTTGNPRIVYNTASVNNNQDGGGGVVLLEVDGTSLNLFSGAISNNTAAGLNGGGILLDVSENGQQLRLYEIEISHNTAANGGGIFQYQGTTYIYNADILQNKATSNGGGIYATCAKSFINGKNDEKSIILFYYGTIRGNQAVGSTGNTYSGGLGGGIYLDTPDSTSYVSVTVYEGQILSNSAYSGGGIYTSNSSNVTATVDGGEILNNSADRAGGGIYVSDNATFYLNGGYISGNTASFNKKNGSKSSWTITDEVYKCDVYLSGTAAGKITTQNGNLAESMENDSEYPVYVMCYSPSFGRKIVIYQKDAVFQDSDADCFAFWNGPSTPDDFCMDKTPVYVTPDSQNKALILSQNPGDTRTVYFDYNYTENGTTTDPVEKIAKTGEKILYSDVKKKVTRDGYDLVGWAKTANAQLEDYVIYYQDGVIYMSYNATQKYWTYKYDETENAWYRWDNTAKEWQYKAKYSDGTWAWEVLGSSGEWVAYTDSGSAFTTEIEALTSDGAPAYTVTEAYNQTLYAQWEVYSVTYNLGSVSANVTITSNKDYGPSVTLLSPSPNTYTAGGVTYTFQGWSTTAGKTELGNGDYKAEKEITLTKSLTLYAVWQPDTITITYAENGGSSSDKTTHTQSVGYGEEATAWNNTTDTGSDNAYAKSGKILIGWSTSDGDNNVEYKFGDTIPAAETKSDLTLYAVWKDIVTVAFDTDGGSAVTSIVSYAGGTVTLPAAPTLDGYSFVGWSDDGTTTYGAGEDYTVASNAVGSVKLTAMWKRVSVTITYKANDGNGEDVEDKVSLDEDYTLLTAEKCEFTKDGYELVGWDADEKATAENATYEPEDTISANTLTKDITLYAIWQEETSGDAEDVNAASLTDDVTEATPTPEPTETPESSAEADPDQSATQEPDDTTEPTPTPEPSAEADPDQSATQEPDDTTEPTPTPEPSAEADPDQSATQEPDDTTEPTPTPEPSVNLEESSGEAGGGSDNEAGESDELSAVEGAGASDGSEEAGTQDVAQDSGVSAASLTEDAVTAAPEPCPSPEPTPEPAAEPAAELTPVEGASEEAG